jgi:NADH-quinone oxidoreductase subunit M
MDMNRVRKQLFLLSATAAATVLLLSPRALAQHSGKPPVPRIQLEPGELTFDKKGDKRTFVIKNVGKAPLSIREVRLGPGGDPAFSLGEQLQKGEPAGRKAAPAQGALTRWPLTLQPGQVVHGTVSYVPTGQENKSGQAFGNLQVKCDDPELADREHTAGLQLVKGKSYILTVMVFFPVITALFILLFLKDGQTNALRMAASIGAAVPFVLAIYLFKSFDRTLGMGDPNFGLQFVHHFVWVKGFNIEFFFGVDGVSVAMVILTAVVSLIAVGASWSVKKQLRGYFIMFLLLEAGMMGVFCAVDFFLFYVFWEVMLLPMYFLIGVWGAPPRVEKDGRVRGGPYSAIKFFLYTLAGSVLMLVALIAIYYQSGATVLVDGTPAMHTFDMMKLTFLNDFSNAGSFLGGKFNLVMWWFLFIGFAIKIPMFPFHTWLPDAHVEAPTAISVILAGVLLKMGTYGIFRLNFQILPHATGTDWVVTFMAVFGVINILYGGLCAMAQKDLKRLVAYSSVSHMGFCLLGMASFTDAGMSGAMFQMFNHGTITSMLFILVGVIYDRAHTRGVDQFGGVATVMPRYAGIFGFAFMASLGLPGLSGFISEALVFLGAFGAEQQYFKILVVLAALGVIVTAAYHLWAIHRIHLGPFNTRWKKALVGHDMDFRETLTLVPLAVIVLVLGFYPMPVLDLIQTGMSDLINLVQPHVASGAVAMVP